MTDREIKIDIGGSGLKVYESPSPQGMRSVCFLVHGYNVSPEQAKRDFDSLILWTSRTGSAPSALTHASWRINWEGYARSWRNTLAKSFFSGLTYPGQIQTAERSAKCLADYILGLHGPGGGTPELIFVAHSLGCRLVLEALQHLSTAGGPRIRLIYFMAAAVPVHLVAPNNRLRNGAEFPMRAWIAYSGSDMVLAALFRIGQAVAERGFPWTAVGYSGQPATGLWTHQFETTNGHSDYFRDPDTARDLAAALEHQYSRPMRTRHIASRNEQISRSIADDQLPMRRIDRRTL